MELLKIAVFTAIFIVVIGINFCSRTLPTQAELDGRVLCDFQIVGYNSAPCYRCYNYSRTTIPTNCMPAFSTNIFNYEIIYDQKVYEIYLKPILCSESANVSIALNNQSINWRTDWYFGAYNRNKSDTFSVTLTNKSDTLSIYTFILKPAQIQ
jgi:hypothetical protein